MPKRRRAGPISNRLLLRRHSFRAACHWAVRYRRVAGKLVRQEEAVDPEPPGPGAHVHRK